MNRKLRLVLDTNVFLVALAPNFKYHWLFQSLLQGKYNLCITNEILLEYEEIICSRYGLARTEATLEFLLLLPNVELITPFYKWNLIAQDEDDNKFVDCAIAANADYIISNDHHLTNLSQQEFPLTIQVLTAEVFAERYQNIIVN